MKFELYKTGKAVASPSRQTRYTYIAMGIYESTTALYLCDKAVKMGIKNPICN